MKWIALAVAVQVALIAAYFLVERARAPEVPFAVERLDEPAPAITVETRTGTVTLASFGDGPVLVHFWATWCVPCRDELPGLLAAAREADLPLLAVTDEPWDTVEAFFGGKIPPEIARDGDAARHFGVSGLPETFVVKGGKIVARTGGARDWTTAHAGEFLEAAQGTSEVP